MRYKAGHKEETRKRILSAAERSFKKGGYCGVGVDGLAKEAGVTSGAFYGHFDSKAAVFKAAITSGMDELYSAITECQQEYGEDWWIEFAKFYTSQKRTCDLTESCALQSITPEVGRSDEAIRGVFETELLKIVNLANDDLSEKTKQQDLEKTWASLAMLIGGVTLARAVKDEKLSNEIATAIKNQVIAAHE